MKRLLLLCAILLFSSTSAADEFIFDIDRYERQVWELGGYLEATAEYLRTNRDGAVYRLEFPDKEKKSFERYQGNLQLSGRYRTKPFLLHGVLNARLQDDGFETTTDTRLYQLYAVGQPSFRSEVEIGKRTLRWGTGYAFNPTAFLERPKEPLDPDLAREGFILAGTEYIRGFAGSLEALSLSAVVLPVTDDINDDFGTENDINLAARVYVLYHDTDIYFMARHGDSRPTALGTAFSKNLAENLEIHGEAAWFDNREIRITEADGTLSSRDAGPIDLLAGFRYLTLADTTWVVEYYRNSAGYTGSEIKRIAAREGDRVPVPQYGAPQPMRNYLYIRAMQNEPFARLYTRAGINTMINLEDGSASIVPEIIYTGFTNLELRGRGAVLTGGRNTDFGERLTRWRLELRGRYYF